MFFPPPFFPQTNKWDKLKTTQMSTLQEKKSFFVILFLSSNDEVAKNVYSHFEVKYGTFAQDKFIKLMFLKNVKYSETICYCRTFGSNRLQSYI